MQRGPGDFGAAYGLKAFVLALKLQGSLQIRAGAGSKRLPFSAGPSLGDAALLNLPLNSWVTGQKVCRLKRRLDYWLPVPPVADLHLMHPPTWAMRSQAFKFSLYVAVPICLVRSFMSAARAPWLCCRCAYPVSARPLARPFLPLTHQPSSPSHPADRSGGPPGGYPAGHHQERECAVRAACVGPPARGALPGWLPSPPPSPHSPLLPLHVNGIAQRSYVVYPPSDVTDEKIQDVGTWQPARRACMSLVPMAAGRPACCGLPVSKGSADHAGCPRGDALALQLLKKEQARKF